MSNTATFEQLAAFAETRRRTMAWAASLRQDQMDWRPASGKWSVGEVLDHVLLAESAYREEIGRLVALKRAGQEAYRKNTFSDVNVRPAFLPEAVMPFLAAPLTVVNQVVPEALRDTITRIPVMPARNPTMAQPRRGRPADALRAELATGLQDTEQMLGGNADLVFDELVTEHPLMGRNTPRGVLRFLTYHEQRHQGQIGALIGDRQFPL